MKKSTVYLLLGSNRGDKAMFLTRAIEQISLTAGRVLVTSSRYETAPWGFTDEEYFINQAVKLETTLSPTELLVTLNNIEEMLGRKRTGSTYESRTIDIDILFYADKVIVSDVLKIPHPLLQERRFTLVPLAEIAPKLVHPVFKKSVFTLLSECQDSKEVVKCQP
jgi:2-amino-4-hydroxy-6-hydroxymethyldihydropteridine diphosphokinase